MSVDTDLRPLRIIASAMCGRAVEVAAAEPGSRTWTDGRTIFLELADQRDRLRLLGVQASLLAGDSLSADVVAELRGHRSLADRYLAVEGHRALAANDGALPPWMLAMIDREVAGQVGSPAASLARARQQRTLAPAWAFGAIDARRIAVEPTGSGPGIPGQGPVIPGQNSLVELEDDADGAELGNLLSSPVGGGGAIGKLMARLLRPTRARGGVGDPGADTPTHRSRSGLRAGRVVVSLATRPTSLDGTEPDEATTHTYPEWDERRRVYLPDWCHVLDDVADADAASSVVLPDGATLRRALARLGTELVPCRRQRQGGDLDIDAVVEAHVDRLAGGPHVEDVYIDSLRRTRGLSVLVLLDISGSAAEPGVAGRTVHEHQRDAAAALVGALDRLGDRVALHAFRSRGRTAVQVTRVKGFDDRLDERVARRLTGLRPGAFTRLGAAIRHGSALIESGGGTPRRLLVVLSDGFAYDHGYEGRHGEADARQALLEARRRGIGCLCLSVGVDAEPSALQRVFGTAAHAGVPTTEHLPETIGPLFAAALCSAEAQRRRSQRTDRTRARLQTERGRR